MKRNILVLTFFAAVLSACGQKTPASTEASSTVTVSDSESHSPAWSNSGLPVQDARDQPTLSCDETADRILINCATDNPAIGDERDFLHVFAIGEDDTFATVELSGGDFTFEPGHNYGICVYTHNSADPNLGDAGIAKSIASTVSFPEVLSAGDETARISSLITYTDAGSSCYLGCEIPVYATADLKFAVSSTGNAMSFDGQNVKDIPLLVSASDGIIAMTCVPGGDLQPGLENSGYMFYWISTTAQ